MIPSPPKKSMDSQIINIFSAFFQREIHGYPLKNFGFVI